MKKACALLITLAVLSVVAPADAGWRLGADLRAQSLEEVNQTLLGRTVTIELFEGGTLRRAKRVSVEPEFVRWHGAKGPEQVSTSEVARISIRFPILKDVAKGLALGTLAGLATAYNELEPEGISVGSVLGAAIVGGAMLGGTALGGVAGTKAVKRRWHVVYEAPFDRYLNDSEPGLREPLQTR